MSLSWFKGATTPFGSAARAAGNFFNANFSNPPPPATKSADEEQQITSLKKNFLDDQQQEAKEKQNLIQQQTEIEQQQLKQQINEEAEKKLISSKFQDIEKIKEQKRNENLKELLIRVKEKLYDYDDKQVLDFIVEQFPPDAITILDTLESFNTHDVNKIAEFIILKNESIMVNSTLDIPGPTDNKYNQLGIKSLPLPASVDIPASSGIFSSARALVECVVDPALCTPDSSEWRCCLTSDARFTYLADILTTQNTTCLPFITANPIIQAMVAMFAGASGDLNGFDDPFPSVIIGDENILYSIGPIIDDDNLLGRPLIMIRIYNYKTQDYPNGIYFWVYPSFSEGGANRVFLTLIGGKFMKGPDYTLTTFILDLLQVHINKYYTKHFVNKQGRGYKPTILNTAKEVICFFGGMLELQTLWVHDVIAGVNINLGGKPVSLIPRGFNRHCYKFNNALQIHDWFNNGIPNMDQIIGAKGELLVKKYAVKFGKENRQYRNGPNTSSFPLCCCVTTILDKFQDSDHVNDFFKLFSRWNKTHFIQGCSRVPGVSPVVAVVTGFSSNVKGMRYNPFIEHLTTPEVAKRFIQKRLVPPITTPETGEQFPSVGMVSRTGSFLHKEVKFGTQERVEQRPLLIVDLRPANTEMQRRQQRLTDLEKTNIVFEFLPQAMKTTIEKIIDIFFNRALYPKTPESELQKIQLCFRCFLGISNNPPSSDDLKQYIITTSLQFLTDGSIAIIDGSIAIIPDSPLFRLTRTIDSGIYRNIVMSSIFDEYTQMPTFPLNITPELEPELMPQVKCSFLNENGQYVEVPGGIGSGDNCDFSGIFIHPLFQPYIFSATRKSMTFPPDILEKYVLNPKIVSPERANTEATIPVKVHNKMFLLRLIFYTNRGTIQVILCVSSTICIARPVGGNPSRPVGGNPYCPFGVDVQFNVASIGPLSRPKSQSEESNGLSTLATILATMNDYLSLGCMVAAKKGEYSKTAGHQQFLDYFDDYFRTIMTECFTYVSAYISPFNCGKDLVMKHFGRVFEKFGDNDISDAIRQKWDWFQYLQDVQSDVCIPTGIITPEMIKNATTSGRRNMQIVVQTFFDPILGILDDQALGLVTDGGKSEVDSLPTESDASSLGYPSSSPASSLGYFSSTSTPPGQTAAFLLVHPLEPSLSPTADPTYRPSQSSVESSVGNPEKRERERSRSIDPYKPREGGALSIKNHNPTYKKKTSKPSKKSRKYIHSKKMMKSKVTKPRTYKRKATGGNRKSKPNKTMRRYRRVRK